MNLQQFISDVSSYGNPVTNDAANSALFFLAENGPISAYDYKKMKSLPYYKYAHKPLQDLLRLNLVQTETIRENSRTKILFHINTQGWIHLIYTTKEFEQFLQGRTVFMDTPLFKQLLEPYFETSSFERLTPLMRGWLHDFLIESLNAIKEDDTIHHFWDKAEEKSIDDHYAPVISLMLRMAVESFLLRVVSYFETPLIRTLKKVPAEKILTERSLKEFSIDHEVLKNDKKFTAFAKWAVDGIVRNYKEAFEK